MDLFELRKHRAELSAKQKDIANQIEVLTMLNNIAENITDKEEMSSPDEFNLAFNKAKKRVEQLTALQHLGDMLAQAADEEILRLESLEVHNAPHRRN